MTRPDGLAEFLAALRRAMAVARPNPAHHALAAIERAGLLTAVLTQNVDGLHQEAGSEEVVEIHGSLLERRCPACGLEERVQRSEFLAGLDHAIRGRAPRSSPACCHCCHGAPTATLPPARAWSRSANRSGTSTGPTAWPAGAGPCRWWGPRARSSPRRDCPGRPASWARW